MNGSSGAGWNARAIRAIVRKDLQVIRRSRAVWVPLLVVPALLLVVIPAFAAFAPQIVNTPGASDITALLERMPAAMQEVMAPYDAEQRVVVLMLAYLFAPLYLLVPTMVASVIAADSFAGEKERKTLEGVLYAPVRGRDLLVGKLLAGWLPAVAVALGGFVLYALVANVAAWPTMGRVWFPNAMWFVLAFWVAPAVAGLGLAATMLVSLRVRTFQEAMQLGGMVVLPLVALVVSQAAGVLYLDVGFVLLLGAFLWFVNALLLAYGARAFRPDELMTQA